MRRRLMDVVAILSLVLCLVACIGLIRSRSVMEQWAMPPRPAPALAGSSYRWATQCFVESAFGRIRLIQTTAPVVDPQPAFGASSPVRYYHRSFGDLYVNYTDPALGVITKGRVVLPGIEHSVVPAQLDPATTGPAPPGRRIELSGFRSFSVSWWLLVVITAMLPAVWGRRRWSHYRRVRRIRHNLCPECGYDLRESGGRCPECGRDRVEPPAPQPTAAI